MKHILLTFSCLLIFGLGQSYAQVDDGNWLIGGDLSLRKQANGQTSYSNGTETNAEENQFNRYNIGLEGGRFLSDQWLIGLNLMYYQSSRETEDYSINDSLTSDQTVSGNSQTVNPFARYYVDLGSDFYFFGEFGAYLTIGKNETVYDGSEKGEESEYTTIGANLIPGVTYFVTDHVGLYINTPTLLSFNYTVDDQKSTNLSGQTTESEITTTAVNGNFQLADIFNPTEISIGVNIVLE